MKKFKKQHSFFYGVKLNNFADLRQYVIPSWRKH